MAQFLRACLIPLFLSAAAWPLAAPAALVTMEVESVAPTPTIEDVIDHIYKQSQARWQADVGDPSSYSFESWQVTQQNNRVYPYLGIQSNGKAVALHDHVCTEMRKQKQIILGAPPASGKTTYAHFLAHQLFAELHQGTGRFIPIFFDLKEMERHFPSHEGADIVTIVTDAVHGYGLSKDEVYLLCKNSKYTTFFIFDNYAPIEDCHPKKGLFSQVDPETGKRVFSNPYRDRDILGKWHHKARVFMTTRQPYCSSQISFVAEHRSYGYQLYLQPLAQELLLPMGEEKEEHTLSALQQALLAELPRFVGLYHAAAKAILECEAPENEHLLISAVVTAWLEAAGILQEKDQRDIFALAQQYTMDKDLFATLQNGRLQKYEILIHSGLMLRFYSNGCTFLWNRLYNLFSEGAVDGSALIKEQTSYNAYDASLEEKEQEDWEYIPHSGALYYEGELMYEWPNLAVHALIPPGNKENINTPTQLQLGGVDYGLPDGNYQLATLARGGSAVHIQPLKVKAGTPQLSAPKRCEDLEQTEAITALKWYDFPSSGYAEPSRPLLLVVKGQQRQVEVYRPSPAGDLYEIVGEPLLFNNHITPDILKVGNSTGTLSISLEVVDRTSCFFTKEVRTVIEKQSLAIDPVSSCCLS